MDTKNDKGIADVSQRMNPGEDADNDVQMVFESLEKLREAQAHEATAAPAANSAGDGSLEAVLTHYRDWLRTLDH